MNEDEQVSIEPNVVINQGELEHSEKKLQDALSFRTEEFRDSMFGMILQYLSMINLMYCSEVCKDWENYAKKEIISKLKKETSLNLEFLWSKFGAPITFMDKLKRYISNHENVEKLSFAYCEKISSECFFTLLDAVQTPSDRLLHLDISFCTNLTEEDVLRTISKFPNLRTLVLTRLRISLSTIEAISKLKNLEKLYLVRNREAIDAEQFIMMLEGGGVNEEGNPEFQHFKSLKEVDISYTSLDEAPSKFRDIQRNLVVVGTKLKATKQITEKSENGGAAKKKNRSTTSKD